MLYLRKSKKGFTLIELMVVVAIIGVLVLLGLRAYSTQKERAMNAIVKANAATVQTMLVGYFGDHDILQPIDIDAALASSGTTTIPLEKMINPYDSETSVYCVEAASSPSDFAQAPDDTHEGMAVCILYAKNDVWVNARGKDGELLMLPSVDRSLPANKY